MSKVKCNNCDKWEGDESELELVEEKELCPNCNEGHGLMDKEELLESLCLYDKRNPYFNKETEEKTSEQKQNCYCDNCFHGKTKIAEYALELYYELLSLEQ